MAVKKWMLKAAVQKLISAFPFRNRVNFWFQKYFTGGVHLHEEHLHWKLTHARDHLNYLRKYNRTPDPLCLELGTGWYPIVPILLYLHGAHRVCTIDLNAHLTRNTLQTCFEKILALESAGRLQDRFPDIDKDRWQRFRKVAANPAKRPLAHILEDLQITAVVGDARYLSWPENTFDFICSNNTFEHISPQVLGGILLEFKRVGKPGAVMSHFIDLSDHFAHADPSINIYNFLRFSEKQWALIDNVIQPQNRRRWLQYKDLYLKLGIPITEEAVRPGSLELLRQVPVHPEWGVLSPEALAVSHGYLVSVFDNAGNNRRK